MPIDTTPKPEFPTVPAVEGAPAVTRDPAVPTPTPPPVATGDSPTATSNLPRAQWGIFDKDNNPVIAAENVNSIEFKRPARLATAPLEKGSFATYNKVQEPYTGSVRYLQGGTEADRNAVFKQIEKAQADLNLYKVVMPDYFWPNANIHDYDVRRTHQSGVTLVTYEIQYQEVREVAIAAFTKTAAPSGADPSNGGNKQPQDPSPKQDKTVSDRVTSGEAPEGSTTPVTPIDSSGDGGATTPTSTHTTPTSTGGGTPLPPAIQPRQPEVAKPVSPIPPTPGALSDVEAHGLLN